MPKPIPPTPDLIVRLAAQIARYRDFAESIVEATLARDRDFNGVSDVGARLRKTLRNDDGVFSVLVPDELPDAALTLIVFDALTAHLTDANAEIRVKLAEFGIDLTEGASE